MSPPSRSLAAVALTAAAAVALAVPATAADEPTTTTTRPSTTTSTTGGGGSSTTTTTRPPDGTSTTSSTSSPSTTAPDTTTSSSSSSSTTTTTTTLAPDVITPAQQAEIDAYPRTPAGSTAELVAVLADVPGAALTGGYGRFPVGGEATWSHDWLFPRHEPTLHFHEGTDVFADRGTPVLSPAAGVATVSHGDVGGLAVQVRQDDGTIWYLAHLDEATVADGAEVTPGVVVGTVGDTGNAAGGAPHVHVEIWPRGGEPLDPKPTLDAYAAEALDRAPAFVLTHRLALLRAGTS